MQFNPQTFFLENFIAILLLTTVENITKICTQLKTTVKHATG